MSDTSQGEGWWLASDGKWYPPEEQAVAPAAAAPASQGSGSGAAAGEPGLVYDIDGPLEMPNWRPLVQWAMAIPVGIVSIAAWIVGYIGLIIAWFAILFTGKMPPAMHNMITLWIRFHFRLMAFYYGWTLVYPPFAFSGGGADDGKYQSVTITLPEPGEEISRLVLIHWLMAIPHIIVLYFLQIAAFIVGAVAWFAVLFTGKYPEGMRDFMIKVARYQFRVMSYVGMLYTPYPAFGL
jgi:hypothetical protein